MAHVIFSRVLYVLCISFADENKSLLYTNKTRGKQDFPILWMINPNESVYRDLRRCININTKIYNKTKFSIPTKGVFSVVS